MKTVKITILGLLLAALSASAQEGMDRFEVQVDGLGCPFCAYGLEKKFKEFKGIKDVTIDIETGLFRFNYPSEKDLQLSQVEAQVEKAGYTPTAGNVSRADGSLEVLRKSPEASESGNYVSREVMVAGNCEMCQARIEKAAGSISGVRSASWDKTTKVLSLRLDPERTNLLSVEEAVARAGHDTEHVKADAEVYDELPGCCHYTRLPQ